MSVIEKGIVVNSNSTISFGNHIASEKVKIDDFKVAGDVYKLRTYNEVTRLTKNHVLVFESTPGLSVHNFVYSSEKVEFCAYGNESSQITVELTPDSTYKILCNGGVAFEAKANAISGKLSFSAELVDGKADIVIEEIK